jgi:alkylation response protein AidB-like acyl-CoA dehydrogenase
MVDFALSEIQTLLRDSARDLFEREFNFNWLRGVEESPDGFDPRLWRQMAELGWLGLLLPEPLGASASLLDFAVLVEEMARHAALSPYLAHSLAVRLLQRWQSPAATEIVRDAAAGKCVLTFALLEADDDFFCREIGARIVQTPEGPALNARKLFVDYAGSADWLVVSALDEATAAPAWAIVSVRDVELERYRTIGGFPQYDLTAARARCAAVEPDPDRAQIEETLQLLALFSAVELVGFAAQALDMAAEYVKGRVQFGQPIGKFQAVQHHIANMAILAESSRHLTYETVQKADSGVLTWPDVLATKALSGRAGTEVTTLAHQLHGGIGHIKEYSLHFFNRRAKETELRWGARFETLGAIGDRLEEIVADSERYPSLIH